MSNTPQDWRQAAKDLRDDQLETQLWNDFKDAFSCFREGDLDDVEAWVDETEAKFVATYESFEEKGHSENPEELMSDAQCSQAFLLEGVEHWLEALSGLRDGADPQEILDQAEHGQRMLIIVQEIKKQMSSASLLSDGWVY